MILKIGYVAVFSIMALGAASHRALPMQSANAGAIGKGFAELQRKQFH